MDFEWIKKNKKRIHISLALYTLMLIAGAILTATSGIFFLALIIIGFIGLQRIYSEYRVLAAKLDTYNKVKDRLPEYANGLAVEMGYADFDDLEKKEAERLEIALPEGLDLNQRALNLARSHGYGDFVELYNAEAEYKIS